MTSNFGVEYPMDWAAWIYSWLRICITADRMTTAKRSHSSRPSTRTTTVNDPPKIATTARATMITGNVNRVMIRKLMTRSTLPPKYPASTPMTVPMIPEVTTVKIPISKEMRAP